MRPSLVGASQISPRRQIKEIKALKYPSTKARLALEDSTTISQLVAFLENILLLSLLIPKSYSPKPSKLRMRKSLRVQIRVKRSTLMTTLKMTLSHTRHPMRRRLRTTSRPVVLARKRSRQQSPSSHPSSPRSPSMTPHYRSNTRIQTPNLQ